MLWEILPRAHLINPLFTSYPSAIWPTFLDMLKATPQQPGILTHTWATVLATVVGFTAAMVLGVAIASALWWWDSLYKVLDPYLVVANAMPKTAFVPIFYIWLGAALSVYGMSLAISLFITILMIYWASRASIRTRSSWRRPSARPRRKSWPRWCCPAACRR